MKRHLLLFCAFTFSVAFVVISYFQSGQMGRQDHRYQISILDKAASYNTALDRETLMVAGGQYISYDRLTRLAVEYTNYVQSVFDDNVLLGLVMEKRGQIERLKMQLSVYRNASRNSVGLIHTLKDPQLLVTLSDDELAVLGTLSRAIIARLTARDAHSRSGLLQVLDNTRVHGDAVNPKLKSLRAHAKVIAKSGVDLDRLLPQITKSHIPNRIAELKEAANQMQAAQNQVAGNWRMALLFGSLVLTALLIRSIQLVFLHSAQLQALNRNLERSVAERTSVLQKTSEHLYDTLATTREQQHSINRLSNALTSAAEGIVVMDHQHKVVYANSTYADAFNYDLQELLNKKHPAAEHIDTLTTLPGIGLEREQRSADFQVSQTDGSQRTYECHLTEIKDPDAADSEYLLIARDVTERRKLEIQLSQAQKLESIGQLAAGIAHEINTPVQYIGSNIQFFRDTWQDVLPVLNLCRQYKGEVLDADHCAQVWEEADIDYLVEEVPTALEQAQSGVEQAAKIVLAMKNFAHPGSESREDTDINEAISDVTTIARGEWKYVADVALQLEDDLPSIRAERSALNQVWLNMIVNAAHAIQDVVGDSSKKGEIRISTGMVNNEVVVTIADTGSGMPQETIDRIFDPFFTTKEVGRGSGQGLSIAHAIISEHGGKILVESTVGQGTAFSIHLPIENNSSDHAERRVA